MIREDIKTINDIVHKTIYGFFDVCSDEEETPMTDKDKLLLEVNKAICNNIKDLEQEPCEDAISRQSVIEQTYNWSKDEFLRVTNPFDYLRKRIASLPSVNPQEPKTGYWIDADSYNAICSCCNRLNHLYGTYCKHCGAKIIDPQKGKDKE